MSRETAYVTTFQCNGCSNRETIGGDEPDNVVIKKGWAIDEVVFGMTVDLCPNHVATIKDLIAWKDPAITLPKDTVGPNYWIQPPDQVCCCGALNPADGDEQCDPCKNGDHVACNGV